MGPQELARNVLGKDSKITQGLQRATSASSNLRNLVQNCDPATGVCSYLPVHSYGEALGDKEKATRLLLGEGAKYTGPTNVSPAALQASEEMDEIFSYSPKNRNTSALKQGISLVRQGVEDRLKGSAGVRAALRLRR